jgi:hypothetical protein
LRTLDFLVGTMLCLAESSTRAPEKTLTTQSRVPVRAATQPPSWDPTIRSPHGNPGSGRRKALPSSTTYARAFRSRSALPVEGSRSGRADSFGCHDATTRQDEQTAAKRMRSYGEEQHRRPSRGCRLRGQTSPVGRGCRRPLATSINGRPIKLYIYQSRTNQCAFVNIVRDD